MAEAKKTLVSKASLEKLQALIVKDLTSKEGRILELEKKVETLMEKVKVLQESFTIEPAYSTSASSSAIATLLKARGGIA